MKQRIRVVKFYRDEEDSLNKVIEEEVRNGWIVKQMMPIAGTTGGTLRVVLLLERMDDDGK